MKDLNIDFFRLFNNHWGLVTAGTPDNFNTMTISWGSIGSLWGTPSAGRRVATIYVKPIRYTYKYIEENEYFTITFFHEKYKKDLGILGYRSGRDGDKIALTSLTPKVLEKGIGFEQAELTLVCRKIYKDDLKLEEIPQDVVNTYYTEEAPHRMYIGEIVDIIE